MFQIPWRFSRSLAFSCRIVKMGETMTTDITIQTFWKKTLENLDSAASELTNRRYNASANRAYYACFQAAIVALMRSGVRPVGPQWSHAFVQAQFAGQQAQGVRILATGYPAPA